MPITVGCSFRHAFLLDSHHFFLGEKRDTKDLIPPPHFEQRTHPEGEIYLLIKEWLAQPELPSPSSPGSYEGHAVHGRDWSQQASRNYWTWEKDRWPCTHPPSTLAQFFLVSPFLLFLFFFPITHLWKAFSDVYSSFLRTSLVYKTHLGRAAWLPGILVFCFSLTPHKKTQRGAEILYFYFLWS